jgi:hypothetical protein
MFAIPNTAALLACATCVCPVVAATFAVTSSWHMMHTLTPELAPYHSNPVPVVLLSWQSTFAQIAVFAFGTSPVYAAAVYAPFASSA